MRLFVAADMMPDAQTACARSAVSVREALGREASAYRFVPPGQMHLTVVFLGAVAPDLAAAYAAALAPAFVQPAFTLTLARVGVFPTSGAPRVVWAGPTGEDDVPMRALRHAVLGRLAAAPGSPWAGGTTPRDDDAFHPHVTLARAKRGRGRPSHREVIESVSLRIAVRVASIALVESRMRADGPPSYHTMARTVLS